MSDDYIITQLSTEERAAEFKRLLLSGVALPSYAAWLEATYGASPPPDAYAPVPIEKRAKFVEALEEAFWNSGGPAILNDLARSNPLEFLKLCAKLIPVDATDKTPRGGLSVTFNLAKPENPDEKIIEPDE